MHAKVRRESVAGYATDETLVCGPKEHTRWWQRYRGHLQGLLYRLILNSYLFIANIHKRWPSCLSNRQIVSTKAHFSCLFRQCRQPGHAGPPPHCHGRSRLALTPTHRAPRNRPRRPAKRPVSACKTAHTGSPYGTFCKRLHGRALPKAEGMGVLGQLADVDAQARHIAHGHGGAPQQCRHTHRPWRHKHPTTL